jgi:hypothetical protein
MFLFFGKENQAINWPSFNVTFNSNIGQAAYIFRTNDCSGAPGMICDALKKIGITPAMEEDDRMYFLKPGEWAIFIPERF